MIRIINITYNKEKCFLNLSTLNFDNFITSLKTNALSRIR